MNTNRVGEPYTTLADDKPLANYTHKLKLTFPTPINQVGTCDLEIPFDVDKHAQFIAVFSEDFCNALEKSLGKVHADKLIEQMQRDVQMKALLSMVR